jgi:hypothetical protein
MELIVTVQYALAWRNMRINSRSHRFRQVEYVLAQRIQGGERTPRILGRWGGEVINVRGKRQAWQKPPPYLCEHNAHEDDDHLAVFQFWSRQLIALARGIVMEPRSSPRHEHNCHPAEPLA